MAVGSSIVSVWELGIGRRPADGTVSGFTDWTEAKDRLHIGEILMGVETCCSGAMVALDTPLRVRKQRAVVLREVIVTKKA